MTAANSATGITAAIVAELAARRYELLSEDSREISRQCLLDWLGVTIAAVREPVVGILRADALEQGGAPQAALLGGGKGSIYAAALINGAAGHALDYDDVAFAMSAHASAVILPALLALAQHRGSDGRAVLTAFVAGYEAASRIGVLVAPDHYERGFHGTATIGTFAAAAACCHLLGLDEEHCAHAVGIAATEAAGIRAMFGTMCKPLHAGRAAENGLRAALLAARGFESRVDVLERPLGFARTHSADFAPAAALAAPAEGYFLYRNLFKFHAACYMTHATIESVLKLRSRGPFERENLQRLVVTIDPRLQGVCTIAAPCSGLETKFSVRHCAALALAGYDTARLDSFTDDMALDAGVAAWRDKVEVVFAEGQPQTFARVAAMLVDGRRLEADHDSDIPDSDLLRQRRRLTSKFLGLAAPRIGERRATIATDLIGHLDAQPSLAPLLETGFGSHAAEA
ncbi:MAG: MmgE/PrpD family protein [Rhodospirillales bacterium]|nr:MmgE/PrpD family protein [Rhodospirillales bacterium]